MRVDIYSDIACPWCFIGLTRFLRVLDGFEHADAVEVALHSFQLDPALPESYAGSEADYLAQRKGVPAASVGRMFQAVADAAATEGLALDFERLKVANSWRAHRLIHAAAQVDAATAARVKLDLFRAHFVDGETVSSPEVLTRIGLANGLAPELTARAASGPARRPDAGGDDLDAAVIADLDRAAEYGISGVPFFVLADTYGVSGAQPAEVFEQVLATVWAEGA